ncbi:MAG: sugar transferase [Gemmatimonadaceae bacterium]
MTQPLSATVAARRTRRTEPATGSPADDVRPSEAPRESVDRWADIVPRDRSEWLNRALHIFVAGVGLTLVFPIMMVIALVVRFSSPGPIFYAQTRVGLDRRWRRTLAMNERRVMDLGGAVFTMYKFRTMRVDAEARSGAIWASANDPRVTPVGRYLRKLRLDELPQLWNILRGDMNVVGPRPERPSIVARLQRDIPNYSCRHRVRPGLTGLAQINQNYDACLDDVRSKVSYDLAYLETQSFLLDLRIMLRTVPAVLLKVQGW